MCVGIQRKDGFPEVVLDEGERPSGCGVVRVDDRSGSEWAFDNIVFADDRIPDRGDERIALHYQQIVGEGAGTDRGLADDGIAVRGYASVWR